MQGAAICISCKSKVKKKKKKKKKKGRSFNHLVWLEKKSLLHRKEEKAPFGSKLIEKQWIKCERDCNFVRRHGFRSDFVGSLYSLQLRYKTRCLNKLCASNQHSLIPPSERTNQVGNKSAHHSVTYKNEFQTKTKTYIQIYEVSGLALDWKSEKAKQLHQIMQEWTHQCCWCWSY